MPMFINHRDHKGHVEIREKLATQVKEDRKDIEVSLVFKVCLGLL